MKLTIIAAALMALAGCSTSTPPAAPTTTAPAAQTVTLTVDANGADQIAYTDPSAPGGVKTQEVSGVFSAKTTVPKGSTVAVTLSGFDGHPVTECTITDATDQLVYVKGKDSCTYVAR